MSKNPIDYIFVIVQILLLVLYLVQPHFLTDKLDSVFRFMGSILLVIGAVIGILGLWQLRNSLSIFPLPTSNASLIEDGVFAFIRHPVYAGILFAAFGWAIYRVDFDRMLFALALMVFFSIKASYEEQKLENHFVGYADYKLHTGKFLPYLHFRKSTAEVPLEQDKAANDGSE